MTNNGRRIVFTSGSGELLKAIHEVYGYSVSSNMIEIKASNDDYDIYGYICKPSILKSNRNHMTTIVNGRCVKNIEVNKAINDGYFTFKPDIKYPVVVLQIETDPTLIDVNIHPTKQDIKFSKIEALNKLITDTISSGLRKTLLVPEIEVEVKTPEVYYNEISMPEVHEEEVEYSNKEQVTLDFKEHVKSYEAAKDKTLEASNSELKENELKLKEKIEFKEAELKEFKLLNEKQTLEEKSIMETKINSLELELKDALKKKDAYRLRNKDINFQLQNYKYKVLDLEKKLIDTQFNLAVEKREKNPLLR